MARVEAQLSRPEASGTLAERLREALASNTMGGKGQSEARWREATADVESAQAAWKRLGRVPGPAAEALRRRFQEACDRFYELRPIRWPVAASPDYSREADSEGEGARGGSLSNCWEPAKPSDHLLSLQTGRNVARRRAQVAAVVPAGTQAVREVRIADQRSVSPGLEHQG